MDFGTTLFAAIYTPLPHFLPLYIPHYTYYFEARHGSGTHERRPAAAILIASARDLFFIHARPWQRLKT